MPLISRPQIKHVLIYPFVLSIFQLFKSLQSLEIYGGGLTDTGVKNIKDLASLTLLKLSQNDHLTDKSLESISGMCTNIFFICYLFPFQTWKFDLERYTPLVISHEDLDYKVYVLDYQLVLPYMRNYSN